MDELQQILMAAAVLIVVIVIFLIFFKDRVKNIKFSNRFGEFSVELDSKLDSKSIRNEFERQGMHIIYVDDNQSESQRAMREAIISNFIRLEEIIRYLAKSQHVEIPGQHSPLELLDILTSKEKDILPNNWKQPIRELYNFGKEVQVQTNAKIPAEYGKYYVALVSSLVDYIRNMIGGGKTPAVPEPVSRRTQIGGPGFLSPTAEKPSAVLYAISGSIQGRRFPIDKSMFRIGENSRNDLTIPDDTFVSGNHAYIRYDNGNLNLFDDQSTNGTFLNNKRLTAQPYSLRVGDEIKIGGCVFKVE